MRPFGFAGRGFTFVGETHESFPVTYSRNEDCLAHETYELAGATTADSHATLRELLVLAAARPKVLGYMYPQARAGWRCSCCCCPASARLLLRVQYC